jgi:hypothetical protein
MTIKITLASHAGELDSRNVDVTDLDSAEISNAIWQAIDDWMLSPGDVIQIGQLR